jgi:hypothetical protein
MAKQPAAPVFARFFSTGERIVIIPFTSAYTGLDEFPANPELDAQYSQKTINAIEEYTGYRFKGFLPINGSVSPLRNVHVIFEAPDVK